jgi:hypothetical protein
MHAWFYNSDFVLNGGFYHEIIEDVSQNRNEVRLVRCHSLKVGYCIVVSLLVS